MSWLPDLKNLDFEKALQGAVAKVDAALDIKEEPGAILSSSAGKSKQELLEENRSNAAVDAVQANAKLSAASALKKKTSASASATTEARKGSGSPSAAGSTDDFFGMFGAPSPTKQGKPPKDDTAEDGEPDAGAKQTPTPTPTPAQPTSKRSAKKRPSSKKKKVVAVTTNGAPDGENGESNDSSQTDGIVSDANQATPPDQSSGSDADISAPPITKQMDTSQDGAKEEDPAVAVATAAVAVADQPEVADDEGEEDGTARPSPGPPEKDPVSTDERAASRNATDASARSVTPGTAAAAAATSRPPSVAADATSSSATDTSSASAALVVPAFEGESISPGPTEEEISDLDAVAASYATKLAHVSMVLVAREEQLVNLNSELGGKNETHHMLLSQIEQLEAQVQDNFTGKLQELTTEFTGRIGDVEKRLNATANDRDQLRIQLEKATSKFSERIGTTDKLAGEVLAEKDAKIEGLMTEGQNLQKKLHESGLRNKKLHAKLKEGESSSTSLSTRVEAAQERIVALEKELSTKAANEEKYKATANQVSSVQDQQSKELIKSKKGVKSLTDKNSSLQAALDTAFKAKAELEKKLAEETVKASSAMTAAESVAAVTKATELKRKEEEFEQVKTDLHAEIADLRATLTRQQNQADRRESNLQLEIADLNERLRHSEQREQQMAESMAQSTKPLVRQIDMIRATLAEQTASADVAEATLVARIEEQAVALQAAEERERQASEKLSEERLRHAGSEDKLASLRKSKIDLQTKLEKQMERADEVDLELHKVQQERKALAASFDGAREEWRVEKLKLKAMSTDTLKTREDEWKRERETLVKQAKETSAARGAALTIPSVATATVRPGSPAGGGGGHTPRAAVGTPAGAIERLNGEVFHKDESLLAVRRQLKDLSKSRAAIADELVVLVAKNEELTMKCAELPKVRGSLAQAERKLDAVMVMYGEKKEEASELQLDLQDFRQLYQAQTQQLCGQIEQLTSQFEERGKSTGSP